MPEIDIQKIDMLITAFNLKPEGEEWDKTRKRSELDNFILNKAQNAKIYFDTDKTSTKMRRKKDDKKDCSVIKIKANGQQELYLMSGHEQFLGEGSYGRAKLAIRIAPPDPDFTLYAIKREWTDEPETKTLQALERMVGDKMQRASTTIKKRTPIPTNSNENNKYYTVMPYLGKTLRAVMKTQQLDEKTKLDLSIQIALQLHDLHTKRHYAHLDLNPMNITVDTSTPRVYKVNLIDFSLSKKLDLSHAELLKKNKKYIDFDVYSLKRILTQPNDKLIDIKNLKAVNRVLYEMLKKNDVADTAAMIAANLILHRLNLYPICVLSDANSLEIISCYEKDGTISKEKLESLYPENIFAAAQILKTHLGVKPGTFMLDDDITEKILSLQKAVKDPETLKNKLQQLFFFTQVLGINIPVEKLSDTNVPFPTTYPKTPCSDKQTREICLSFFPSLKFNLNRITVERAANMMHIFCTEQDELKKNLKLLAVYLNITISDDFLNSKYKCENLLNFYFVNAKRGEDVSRLMYPSKKYLILSEIAIIGTFDVASVYDFFKHCDIKELENCQQYLQPPHTDKRAVHQPDELKIKVNKMLTIQMTFALFFSRDDLPINAAGLYAMPEPQLDSLLATCNTLLSMLDKETFYIETDPEKPKEKEEIEKKVDDLKLQIITQVNNTNCDATEKEPTQQQTPSQKELKIALKDARSDSEQPISEGAFFKSCK